MIEPNKEAEDKKKREEEEANSLIKLGVDLDGDGLSIMSIPIGNNLGIDLTDGSLVIRI